MAISLARARRTGAKIDIAKKQTAEYETQAKKAKKRGFFSGILGKGLGAGLGSIVAGGLGIASGGLLMPLIMAGTSMLGKKAAHEMTRGMGADASKISESDMYGFGKESGKTLRGDLESQMVVDPFKEKGGFGKELLSSTLSAGLSGELGGVKGVLQKGGGGSDQLLGIGEYGTGTKGVEGAMAGFGDLFGKTWGEGEGGGVDVAATKSNLDYTTDYSGQTDEIINPELDELGYSITGEQGGQVPQQQQLLQLLALASMQQQQNAYSDTPLEDVKHLSIADKFAAQGKTLGGNDIQSLSQKLGR